MDANELYAIENVVRVVFPQTMINEGELLPAAFKLRERADGPEQYISVFRQYAESFSKDILSFDKQRNLPCCIMNVGEITKIELKIADNQINYKVKSIPTENYTSMLVFSHISAALSSKATAKMHFRHLKLAANQNFI